MRLNFIRHAQTTMDLTIHPSKWSLSEQGEIQAQSLSTQLKKLSSHPRIIYTSTEIKAILTMTPYSKWIDAELRSFPQFNELHLPECISSQIQFKSLRKLQFEDYTFSYKGSETPEQALTRFEMGLSMITEDTAIVCTHGTILSLFLANYHGWSSDRTFEFWQSLPYGKMICQIKFQMKGTEIKKGTKQIF